MGINNLGLKPGLTGQGDPLSAGASQFTVHSEAGAEELEKAMQSERKSLKMSKEFGEDIPLDASLDGVANRQ